MAEELTLASVTQEQYDAAEQTLLGLIRQAYPQLDLRNGTVLRETLVRPASTVAALEYERVEQLRRLTSLLTMVEDGTATEADVNKILANFNMTQYPGVKATGTVKVKVDSARIYTIAPGAVFTTLAGLRYTVDTLTVARLNPGDTDIPLNATGDGSYYFLVAVTAADEGAIYNIPQGTAMNPASRLYGFVSAQAYMNFTSGLDNETLEAAISRIPAALSHRGLTNRTAVEAQLRANFAGSGIQLQAVSVQGYGDRAMLRDKHNVFGVAHGGRVDVYARTFTAPATALLLKTGTRTVNGTYTFTIDKDDAPGFYAIRIITDPEGTAMGTYQFTETRGSAGLDSTWHDIDVSVNEVEAAFTVFQNTTVTVTGVPDGASTHQFKVEAYVAPGLADLQAYMDDDSTRNVAADFLVRCPPICLVACAATVYYDLKAVPDMEQLRALLVSYINSRSFTPRLTRSELASVLLSAGVKRVDLETGNMQLQGRVLGADGVWRTLSGDSLTIADVEDPRALLTSATTVFAAEPQDILLTGVGE